MKYMVSPMFSQEDASLLMRLRTRCVNGIRSDFCAMYADTNCPHTLHQNQRYIATFAMLCQVTSWPKLPYC